MIATLTSASFSVFHGKSRRTRSCHRRLRINCYKDSPIYSKPTRLLVAAEPKQISEISRFELNSFPYTIQIKFQTSKSFGSELSNLNAGVIVCLIDINGDSILQRIPSILDPTETPLFQRGSVDEIMFDSPRLNRIEALWLGVDSGQWRLSGARVVIIEKESRKVQLCDFITDEDVLIGEEPEMSLIELKPIRLVDLTEPELVEMSFGRVQGFSNEETMREYDELKSSLLSYDVGLVGIGTFVTGLLVNESTALSLFLGGICGFLYLLLIQKTVDDLSASQSTILKNNVRFSVNAVGVVLVAALTIVLAKRSSSDVLSALTSRDLVAGMVGFLACKFAVVIAGCKRN